MIKMEASFIEDEAVKSVARMLRDITNVEGRFDLTDNIKRSKNLDEFTDAVYNALRIANSIKKQERGVFIHVPNDKELEKVFAFAKDTKCLSSLKNVVASYALSFPSKKEPG
jgi:CRISPR type I-A-associated protein Csa5